MRWLPLTATHRPHLHAFVQERVSFGPQIASFLLSDPSPSPDPLSPSSLPFTHADFRIRAISGINLPCVTLGDTKGGMGGEWEHRNTERWQLLGAGAQEDCATLQKHGIGCFPFCVCIAFLSTVVVEIRSRSLSAQ